MAKNMYSTKYTELKAFFIMLLGAVLMIVLVISFNKNVKDKELITKEKSRVVNVASTKKQVTNKPKPKPKPKPKKSTPKAPAPNLNSMLGGIAMNIPEFATENITGDTNDLLDDIVEDTVMTEGTVDSKPKVTSRTPMEYPADALKDGIKGYVIVNLLIANDGTVEIAKVIESNPEGVFDNTALNGARSWRFTPATYKGQPVKVWAKQKISFN